MKDMGKQKNPDRKKKIIAGTISIVILILVGSVIFLTAQEGGKEPNGRREIPGGLVDFGRNGITASGSTSVGMQEESFELDYIETELKIEQVYLASQDEVEEGTAILKLTEESVEKARKELEKKATEASLNYRQQLLSGETEKITARQAYDTSVTNGTYASYTREESLKEYADTIADLEEQILEAQELVEEYTASVESDYYYTYYKVAEKKEEFERTFSALMQLHEEWNVPWLEDHYSAGTGTGESAGSGASSGEGTSGQAGGAMMGGGYDENASKLSVYNMLDEEVQENEKIYDQAVEDYEAAKKNAESSLSQAQSNLKLLTTQLEEAQIAYDKQQVTSQNDYESTMAESNSAQSVYESELNRIEEATNVALNEKEEAEENLQEFEKVIGDGCLYTGSAGTVMMVAVREESVLSENSMVLAYSNPEAVTVTASVDQADISSIRIGQGAQVQISDYGTFQGTVSKINPVSQSNSKSNIYYSVTIELSGDVSGLSQNLSAVVTFETGRKAKEEAVNETEAQK